RGVGVDASAPMLERARLRARFEPNLTFGRLDGPQLPVDAASMDVVVCVLAWRYLDWDPMVAEIRRVLRPGGQLLLIDMAVAPFKPGAVPRVLLDKLRVGAAALAKPRFRSALRRLVDDPRWRVMLANHPMRAEHEYRWYLPSRFASMTVEVLNRAVRSEMLAFAWRKPRGQADVATAATSAASLE
ncbi:MAG: class I SAM-dependent methyltransferase, partial [Pseudomonadota bacterium]|nr:class I SAM-dependent methyltransferase [Pseudomonadota bacterium]